MATTPGQGANARPRRRRSQLSDDVARELRSWIMSGKLRPGAAIHLDETATELDVSITPVRDALLTLCGEGFVEPGHRRGFVVTELSREDVLDIFWLQSHVAVELAQRAARHLTPAGIDALQQHIEQLRTAVAARDVDAIANAEFAFHRELNHLARASKLAWLSLKMSWYAPHRMYSTDHTWGEFAVASHERLISALREANMTQIAAETQVLFADAAQRLLAHLEHIGVWDESELPAADTLADSSS
ncbi:GntR family transcriptional regulator [Nocardia fluminea]|uniref:GntR family transcriptional regulator n=1 Tax=Nocardia fluminea TaxID=134984 RepID=UPI00343528F3